MRCRPGCEAAEPSNSSSRDACNLSWTACAFSPQAAQAGGTAARMLCLSPRTTPAIHPDPPRRRWRGGHCAKGHCEALCVPEQSRHFRIRCVFEAALPPLCAPASQPQSCHACARPLTPLLTLPAPTCRHAVRHDGHRHLAAGGDCLGAAGVHHTLHRCAGWRPAISAHCPRHRAKSTGGPKCGPA